MPNLRLEICKHRFALSQRLYHPLAMVRSREVRRQVWDLLVPPTRRAIDEAG